MGLWAVSLDVKRLSDKRLIGLKISEAFGLITTQVSWLSSTSALKLGSHVKEAEESYLVLRGKNFLSYRKLGFLNSFLINLNPGDEGSLVGYISFTLRVLALTEIILSRFPSDPNWDKLIFPITFNFPANNLHYL